MATTMPSDLVINDEQFRGGYIERQDQNITAFNAASNGCLALVSEQKKGDYEKEAFFDLPSNLVTRQNTASVAAVESIKMTMDEFISVKLDRKAGPVDYTLKAFRRMAEDPALASYVIGRQVSEATMKDQLNSLIRALVAALANQADLLYDYSGTGTITHGVLASGMAKRGDRAQEIALWVMNSKPYFNLVGQSISDKITNVADAVIYSGQAAGLGRPILVTDATPLYVSGSPDTYYTLGLVPGAAVAIESEVTDMWAGIVSGLEQLVGRIQGQFAYNIGLKGFKWDTTDGGANPTDATVATGSNWDKVVASRKDLAGVIIKTQ